MSSHAWRKNISSNGVARMIEVITSKLNEMTGMENSTLAKYVVILVQQNKPEEEIKKHVETFLGARSGPFASWLCDHLSSHLHDYTSPQPKILSAKQGNILAETRSKKEQTESSINANLSGVSLVGSAKQTQPKPNDTDGEDEDKNTEVARKSVFERLGKFHEWNTNFQQEAGIKNRKRSRPNYENDVTINDDVFQPSKRLKMEYKLDLPRTLVMPITPVVPSFPTKTSKTPASTRKVFGTARNTGTKAKRTSAFDRLGGKIDPLTNTGTKAKTTSLFDRLGEKIDPLTKGINRIAVNEGNQTSQKPEVKSVVVSNVHYGATKEALNKLFTDCGEVAQIHMLKNNTSGSSTGTAIVEFASKQGAQRALSMDGSTFMYRRLQVKPKSASDPAPTGQEHNHSSRRTFEEWKRYVASTPATRFATASNIASSTPATTSNIANSTRSATTSNIANSTRSATTSNIANLRRQFTYQRNPSQNQKPTWK